MNEKDCLTYETSPSEEVKTHWQKAFVLDKSIDFLTILSQNGVLKNDHH